MRNFTLIYYQPYFLSKWTFTCLRLFNFNLFWWGKLNKKKLKKVLVTLFLPFFSFSSLKYYFGGAQWLFLAWGSFLVLLGVSCHARNWTWIFYMQNKLPGYDLAFQVTKTGTLWTWFWPRCKLHTWETIKASVRKLSYSNLSTMMWAWGRLYTWAYLWNL